MAKIESALKSLTSGVSQQSEALRGPGHLQEIVNYIPDIIEGTRSRPGAKFLHRLNRVGNLRITEPDGHLRITSGGAFRITEGGFGPWSPAMPPVVHWIDKSLAERYVVLCGNSAIKVFDIKTGEEKTVATPDGTSYLSGASFSFLSLKDFTFIVNKSVVVEEETGVTAHPTLVPEALIHVKQGDYKVTYSIQVYTAGGTLVTSVGHTTTDSAGSVENIRPSKIANELFLLLDAALDANWVVNLADNVIIVARADGADFKIRSADTINDTNIKTIKGQVRAFTDLPNTAPNGHVVEVLGDPTIPDDNYWVKAEVLDVGSISKVVWKETMKPGVTLRFRSNTAPHVLVREGDGTFTFRKAQWGERVVGDAVRSPMPSFVGRKIDYMSATQGRLFAFAEDNAIASRSGDLFHFFRQSATALLDDDPIDVSALYPKEVRLRAGVPWNKQMLLFANTAQFILEGGAALIPKTAQAPSVGTWSAYPEGGLAAATDRVFIPFIRSEEPFTAGILQWATPAFDTTKPVEGTDITEHVPTYIEGRPVELACSSEAKVLAARTDSDPGMVWGYRWQVDGRAQLTQMAWFKLQFPSAAVLGMTFFASKLYAVAMTDGGDIVLEAIELAPVAWEPLGFLPCIDLWTVVESGVVVGPNTTFTLPFDLPGGATPLAISLEEANLGAELTVVSAAGDTVTVTGAYPNGALLGIYMGDLIELPKFFFRRPSQDGGFETIPGDRLHILRIGVGVDDSGPVDIVVQCKGQPQRLVELPDKFPQSGTRWLGVGAKNLDAKITISRSSIAPARLMFVRWRANLIQMARIT